MIEPVVIYVLWLREMKRFVRAKSRLVGSIMMPLFLLVFLGMGFRNVIISSAGTINYTQFLVPGILGMTILSNSLAAGISVLWDREFGFLKEIMVAPVSRVSIVLGRIVGGATTSMIQALMILGISLLLGFGLPNLLAFLLSILFMLLISFTFAGFGLAIASRMRDIQGFGIIMNFIIMPLIFLSGAIVPLQNLPDWLKYISYIDPLTFGVDGLRGALINASMFPLIVDFVVMLAISAFMVLLGAYLFEKSESA